MSGNIKCKQIDTRLSLSNILKIFYQEFFHHTKFKKMPTTPIQSEMGSRSGSRPDTRRTSSSRSPYGNSSVSLLLRRGNSVAFRIGTGGYKVPKYQNTYQLESPNPWEISVIDGILKNVMNTTLKDINTYNSAEALKLCKDMGSEVRKQIYKKDYDRYKYIVTITIIEKIGQGTNVGLGFIWDHQRDNYSKHVFENMNFYAIGIVASVYYE